MPGQRKLPIMLPGVLPLGFAPKTLKKRRRIQKATTPFTPFINTKDKP